MRNLVLNTITTLIMFGVLYLTMLFVQSCAKYYTLSEAQKLLNANINDVGKASAQVVLQTGLKEAEIKAANLKRQYNDQRILFFGIVAGVAVLFILAYFKLTAFAIIPVSVIAACVAGIGLIRFDMTYPKAVPLLGGFGTLIFGGAAAYWFIKKNRIFDSAKELVQKIESIKPLVTSPNDETERLNAVLNSNSSFTKKLVAKVKAKL